MAEFTDCSTNSYVFDTLLRALFGITDADGTYGIRIIAKDKLEGGVITCATKDNLDQLFRKAIGTADDGYPALNVCSTEFADGAGLSFADECGVVKPLDLLKRLSFVECTDGEIGLNLLNIT